MSGISHQQSEKGQNVIREALLLNDPKTFDAAFKTILDRYMGDVKNQAHNLVEGAKETEWVRKTRNEALNHLFNSLFMTASSRHERGIITQDQLRRAIDVSFAALDEAAPFFEPHLLATLTPSRRERKSSELKKAILTLWDAKGNEGVRKAVSIDASWEPHYIASLRLEDTTQE